MAEVIQMPLMSDTMTEGVIVAWHKKVGDVIKSGDLLAEIETDKATMEFESIYDGVLLYVAGKESEAVKVGDLLAIIGKENENIDNIIAESKKQASSPIAAAPEKTAEPASASVAASAPAVVSDNSAQQAIASSEDDRLKASPLAKAMAKESGVPLNVIQGSGEGGRIIKRDVDEFIKKGVTAPMPFAALAPQAGESYQDITLSQMRKTIARRLSDSKFSAPHYYLTMEIDMTEAAKVRTKLNEISDTKISFNDMIVKACALALKKHPKVNASWLDGDKIRLYNYINVGVAVAIEDGLIVPVVRNADHKGLSDIAKEVRELATKAKNKELQPPDFTGNTFTISNLGMFGIDQFTAIINPPDSCILAVGSINEVPVFVEVDGKKKIRAAQKMKVTLSCDHRVVDGAVGSEFLQTVRYLLENPLRMLL